jgi:hypothetical protein
MKRLSKRFVAEATPTQSRRTFLRAASVTLALPLLEATMPTASERRAMAAFGPAGVAATGTPRRMVCICTPLGLHTPNLFPAESGADYTSTPYLDVFGDLRKDLTVISGLAHPGIDSGHDSIFSFLTAAPHPERRAGFRNTISLDQVAAEQIGGATRFPSLTLSCEGFTLSWTRSGAPIPPDFSPSRLFAKLFLEGRPEEVQLQLRRLQDGQSILDSVAGEAATLQRRAGGDDREKLDEYFTSVRELEQRLATSEEWSRRPKPKVDAAPPRDATNPADLLGKSRLLFDLTHLALETDSTRLVTIMLLGSSLVPPIAGVSLAHHDLSHHGQDETKLGQLKTLEVEKLKVLAEFLTKLKGTREQDENLLDRTSVYFSSNLGNASSHSCRNLPVILAGGGFRHGRHLALDGASAPPLSNLYLSLLQRLGVEASSFGTSTGTLTGLQLQA